MKVLTYPLKKIVILILQITIPFLLPNVALADVGDDIVKGLKELIDIIQGPIGITMMSLAIMGAGFMFYIGKWDIMRLIATAVGAGLIYFGADLADVLYGG